MVEIVWRFLIIYNSIMEVVVTGIGLISALGNLAATWQGLLGKQSGIKLNKPFSQFSALPLALIGNQPVDLSCLIQDLVLATLEDARLFPPLVDCGVVIASSRAFQAQWELLSQEVMRGEVLSLPWLPTLPNHAALMAARYLQTHAPVIAPMAACASGLWAIARAYELIKMGECERVLVGAVESPITPLTLAGFNQIGALAQTGCYPFDRHREGLVLGEGGALLVLETEEVALQRKAKIYGKILGFGATCDGYHVSAPSPTGKTAITAIKRCLQASKLDLGEISYIHAHGTSTRLNDEIEALIINSVLPEVAVSSTKGVTGHTLGASGAIGATLCLMALQEQILPPCVGLKESEFDLNLIQQATSFHIKNTLCFSFGFGGQNLILALGRY
jgi:3-oxoacyl-[acyl-carrier-protein] synthase II